MHIAIVTIFLLTLIATYLIRFVFPIATGFAAKMVASGIFVQQKALQTIKEGELSSFPLNKVKIVVNDKNKTITTSLLGFAKKTARFRPGLGCTLWDAKIPVNTKELGYTTKNILNQHLPWPIGNAMGTELPANLNLKQLELALENVLNAPHKNGKKSAATRAALVVHDGKLVAEIYAPGYTENSLHLGWSITKTITAALLGILAKENKVDEEKPAPISVWKGTAKEFITTKNILQQTTGIKFLEKYGRPGNVTKMLFGCGDMAGYVASLPLSHKPGSHFSYSSGNTNLLSLLLKQLVPKDEYLQFPYKALFEKINAPSFLLETDCTDMYIGSSYSYATIKDFARFGLLYLQNGMYNGEQILPTDWVAKSTQPSTAENSNQYGYQTWLNGIDKNGKKMYPSASDDLYCFHGFGAQGIYIIPSKKLMVLRFGLYEYDEDNFLKEVLNAIEQP